jgi:hypothetical protein
MLLEPVELHTLNLGGHTGQAAYQQLSAAAALASSWSSSSAGEAAALQQQMTQISFSSATLPVPAHGAAATVAAAGQANSVHGGAFVLPGYDATALAALAAGARGQVSAVKQHCEALLGGLQQLCNHAVTGEATVAALRQRRDELLLQLARR